MAEEFYHTGQPMRSGRYPYGSGEDPYQRITRGKGSFRSKKEKILKEIQKKAKLKEEKKIQKEVQKSAREKKKEEYNKKYESLEGLLDTASKDSAKRYSDDELQARISRLKLEKEYRNLVSELNPKVKSRGKKFLEEVGGHILRESVKDVGTQAAKYILGEGINTITGKRYMPAKMNKSRVVSDAIQYCCS